MKHYPVNHRGVALVVVLLVILAATAIGVVSLKLTQNEARMSMAFKYNRQASQIANQIGAVTAEKIHTTNPSQVTAEANSTALEEAYKALKANQSPGTAFDTLAAGAKWYYPSEISEYTGLAGKYGDTNKKFEGDLSRPVTQVGHIGNFILNQNKVEGFSNGDTFCSQTVHANSYALVGRSIPIHNPGSKSYYLLSELSGRISGFKREMGLFNVGPMPCNN